MARRIRWLQESALSAAFALHFLPFSPGPAASDLEIPILRPIESVIEISKVPIVVIGASPRQRGETAKTRRRTRRLAANRRTAVTLLRTSAVRIPSLKQTRLTVPRFESGSPQANAHHKQPNATQESSHRELLRFGSTRDIGQIGRCDRVDQHDRPRFPADEQNTLPNRETTTTD